MDPLTRRVSYVVDFGVGTVNSVIADVAGATTTAGVTLLAAETGPVAPVIGGVAGVGAVIGSDVDLSKAYSYYRQPLIHGVVTTVRGIESASITARTAVQNTNSALSNAYGTAWKYLTEH